MNIDTLSNIITKLNELTDKYLYDQYKANMDFLNSESISNSLKVKMLDNVIEPAEKIFNSVLTIGDVDQENVFSLKDAYTNYIIKLKQAKLEIDSIFSKYDYKEPMLIKIKEAWFNYIDTNEKCYTLLKEEKIMPVIEKYWRDLTIKKTSITASCVAIITTLTSLGLRFYSTIKVKNLVKAISKSRNYIEMVKYINALKSMRNNSWFTTSASAKELANMSLDRIKKIYIATGTALIIVSCIVTILFGFGVGIASSFSKLLKGLDFDSLIDFLKKVMGLGFLIIPGIIGVCLIGVALRGFQEKGTAETILTKLSPAIILTNQIVKHFTTDLIE